MLASRHHEGGRASGPPGRQLPSSNTVDVSSALDARRVSIEVGDAEAFCASVRRDALLMSRTLSRCPPMRRRSRDPGPA